MKKQLYADYIQDILDSIGDIEEFVKDLSIEEFAEDRKTINAVVRSFEVIGEAAKNIPDSIKSKYSNIPWRQMTGMRDKLIHEYFGVDLEIVWETIKQDLPKLKLLIKKLEQELI